MDIFGEVTQPDVVKLLKDITVLVDAGFGQHAKTIIGLASERFRMSVEVQHHAGLAARTLGDRAAAVNFFERGLAAYPGFAYTEMELASTINELGDHAAAIAWAHRAVASAPDCIPAYLLAANLESLHGSTGKALEVLERARQFAPADRCVNAALGEVYCYHNRRPDAAKIFSAVVHDAAATPHDHIRYLQVLTEIAEYQAVLEHVAVLESTGAHGLGGFATFCAAHARLALAADKKAVVTAALRRESSGDWLDEAALLEYLGNAIQSRQPLAFIRHGDGEARFLCATDPVVRSLVGTNGARAIGDSIWHNWFDVPLPPDGDLMLRLRDMVLDSISGANVLGLPTAKRLDADCFHFGYLAYLDKMAEKLVPPGRGILFTDASVPELLHRRSPHLRAILAGLPFLGTITCHQQLGARLRASLGITAGNDILVPAEMRVPGRPKPARPHFPDLFLGIMDSLTVPHAGAVYLVGAGLLGKVYCRRISELGGIALDIGSVADAWAGINTRESTFKDLDEWALPAIA